MKHGLEVNNYKRRDSVTLGGYTRKFKTKKNWNNSNWRTRNLCNRQKADYTRFVYVSQCSAETDQMQRRGGGTLKAKSVSGRVAPLAPASRTVNPSWPSNSPINGEAILNRMPRNHPALITYWKLVDLLEYLIDILPLLSVYVCTKDFKLCLHHNCTFQLQFYTLGNL